MSKGGPDLIERPSGATQIVISKQSYPLKVYLVFVFGLVIVAVAFGGMGWLSGLSSNPPGAQSSTHSAFSVDKPIYVLLTVLTDKPVTITPTPTETMTRWEATAAAQPTNTPIPYQIPESYPFATQAPTHTPTPLPTPRMNDSFATEADTR